MKNPALEVPAPQNEVSLIASAGDHPRDAPLALARLAALAPRHRFSVATTVPGRQLPQDILPPESVLVCQYEGGEFTRAWARHADLGILITAHDGFTELVSLAATRDEASAGVARLQAACKEPVTDTLAACLWLMGRQGPTRSMRQFQSPAWEGVRQNYPASTRTRIDALVADGVPDGSGRLLLWHGPPGTGKTSAVLGLLQSWKKWCSADVIADPERMFQDAAYLMEVLGQRHGSRSWRMIVCEDADEYLRSDARQRSGAGLGRLLNASDGLLGRGSRNLVLLTTNDELGRLHPAVTRPGRCLSLVEFGLFPPDAASAWLEQEATGPMSLAEMFEQRRSGVAIQREEVAVGAYM